MRIRRVAIENVRSFLDRAELLFDGPITIVIGPNGGGKTNLLDTILSILRRHIFASMYAAHNPTAENPNRHEFRVNDALNRLVLEKHSAGDALNQLIEIEIEATKQDIANMEAIKGDGATLIELAGDKYINVNTSLHRASFWAIDAIAEGQRFVYRLNSGSFSTDGTPASQYFLEYLNIFEIEGSLREEFDLSPLSTPLIYLPVNRAASGFQSNVELAGYNAFETKRNSDAASSRNPTSVVNLAVGRLAQKFRLLLEQDSGEAVSQFKEDANLKELTKLLEELGYEWNLETINPLKNQYDVRLKKQGSSFLVGAASSGERELLTYLFAIFALNVKDALIIVDEPELHLHPKWQKILIQLFIRLSATTGNQFLLATHSPTFVSPESIQFVSRVFSKGQRSHILRLNSSKLPEERHLLNIVNSQNNERLFFSDEVVLVEGLSDRIFFENVLDRFGRSNSSRTIIEVIAVGGKGFFEAYAKVLRACEIPYSIIADLDYVEQVGSDKVKGLFAIDKKKIKQDVFDNVKSLDSDALIEAIDLALLNGTWTDASQIWEYIKTSRRRLKRDLTIEETAELTAFIQSKREDRTYVLQLGALEDYLPLGYRAKNLDKLIHLLADKNYWTQLTAESANELEMVANSILKSLQSKI